jgi:hypothetical protein
VRLRDQAMNRVVEPAALRFMQWRGDPVARLMHARTRTDPYPLYAEARARPLLRSPLGAWLTASLPRSPARLPPAELPAG